MDEREQAAQGLRRQAGAVPNPRFFYQSENLRPEMDFGQNVDTYVYAVQPIEVSGRRGARIQVAQGGIGQAALNRDLQRQEIEYAVAQSFWDALRLVYLRKLAEETQGFYREMLDYHQKRFNEGKLAAVDLMRIQLEFARAQTRAESSRLAEAQAMQKLAQEMGLAVPGAWELKAEFEALNEPRPEALTDKAFEQRMDVKLAAQRIEAARANLMLQQAQGRPDLDMVLGYKRTAGNNTMLGGMQMNLPFWDRNRGGVQASRSDLAAEHSALTAAELKSESEWKLAHTAYLTWQREVNELYAPMLAQSKEIAGISRAAYREGGLDLLRLLDAERLRVETQTAWAEALGNYHQSVLTLHYAAGLEP